MVMMLRRSHPDREVEGAVRKGGQWREGCGMQAHAGQRSREGESSERRGRLREDGEAVPSQRQDAVMV